MFERLTVSANGLEFACLETGEGPLALCLHGFPDSPHSMRHLMPALADAGFHAVAPYMRGYAPTGPAPDGKYHVGALVADVCALHEQLGGDGDAVLIGSDWGALATYGTAAFAPERWTRVVTMAIPPVPVLGPMLFTYDLLKRFWYQQFFLTPFADDIVPLNDLEFVENLWADWSPGLDGGEDLQAAKEAVRDPECLAAALSYYRAALDPDFDTTGYEDEQLCAMSVPSQPTLYLSGVNDGCIPGGVIDETLDVLSEGSRAELINDAGHFIQLDQPDVVNGLIVDFVAG